MPAYTVFKEKTGEIILGGVIGAPSADAISGLIAGLAKQTGWAKFGVKTAFKVVWSLAWLAAAEFGTRDEDVQNVLVGVAAAPLFTIPSDAVEAQTGSTISNYAYDWGLAKAAQSAAARAAGGRPVVVTKRATPTTVPTRQVVQIRGGRG